MMADSLGNCETVMPIGSFHFQNQRLVKKGSVRTVSWPNWSRTQLLIIRVTENDDFTDQVLLKSRRLLGTVKFDHFGDDAIFCQTVENKYSHRIATDQTTTIPPTQPRQADTAVAFKAILRDVARI